MKISKKEFESFIEYKYIDLIDLIFLERDFIEIELLYKLSKYIDFENIKLIKFLSKSNDLLFGFRESIKKEVIIELDLEQELINRFLEVGFLNKEDIKQFTYNTYLKLDPDFIKDNIDFISPQKLFSVYVNTFDNDFTTGDFLEKYEFLIEKFKDDKLLWNIISSSKLPNDFIEKWKNFINIPIFYSVNGFVSEVGEEINKFLDKLNKEEDEGHWDINLSSAPIDIIQSIINGGDPFRDKKDIIDRYLKGDGNHLVKRYLNGEPELIGRIFLDLVKIFKGDIDTDWMNRYVRKCLSEVDKFKDGDLTFLFEHKISNNRNIELFYLDFGSDSKDNHLDPYNDLLIPEAGDKFHSTPSLTVKKKSHTIVGDIHYKDTNINIVKKFIEKLKNSDIPTQNLELKIDNNLSKEENFKNLGRKILTLSRLFAVNSRIGPPNFIIISSSNPILELTGHIQNDNLEYDISHMFALKTLIVKSDDSNLFIMGRKNPIDSRGIHLVSFEGYADFIEVGDISLNYQKVNFINDEKE